MPCISTYPYYTTYFNVSLSLQVSILAANQLSQFILLQEHLLLLSPDLLPPLRPLASSLAFHRPQKMFPWPRRQALICGTCVHVAPRRRHRPRHVGVRFPGFGDFFLVDAGLDTRAPLARPCMGIPVARTALGTNNGAVRVLPRGLVQGNDHWPDPDRPGHARQK